MLSAYPEGVPVHYVFAQRAQESPDAPALIGTEGVLTYAQLDQRADQIAGLLRKHGVSSGDFVATALHRSLDMPATFLAILKCGAAYCPLDLNHPAERIQLILQDAKIAAIVTDLEHASGLPQTDVRLLVLDKPGTFDGVESATLDLVHPQDVMCLLYTSGSTGLPKGVLIPHKGVIRLLFESNYIPFGSHLCMLHHAPLVFDASTYEIWGSLLHGGKCVLYPGKGLIFHELRDAIRKYQVNSLLLGPAPFNLIIDEDPDVLTGIEYLVIAGEAMSATHSRKALAKFPDLHLVNGYGPTEATTFATTYTISRDFSRDAKSVPIGKAIARTTLYIYDSNNNLITDDAPGELFIGGVGVAMGYLNRPELTAEKFIADPFSQDPNARLYRTGDLCRWMPDGNLDYIGRIDHQVKIRGHRIEPGEIETVMQKHPGIAQCILVAGGDPSDRFLIGYYTVRKGQTCTPEQLRNHLTATLPAYLVPQWLTPLEKLPINANGKVDRKALPDPRTTVIVQNENHQPQSQTESDLLELWKQILGIPQLGTNDCFFSMGGTSIGMMKLCTLIERRMGKFVSVNTFIAASTVAKMAAFLASDNQQSDLGLAIQLREGNGIAPPLFIIPGLSGHPMSFMELSRNLDHPGAIYGLEFPYRNHAGNPVQTVEEIADLFNEAIARITPPQNVHLMGYSFGGLVAYEMARQLQLRHLQVRSLILLDSFLPSAVRPRNPLARLGIHARRAWRHGFGAKAVRMFEKDASFANGAATQEYRSLRPNGAEIDRLTRRAFDTYRPGTYKGDLIFIHPMEIPEWLEFCIVDPSGGWRSTALGNIRNIPTPGNHLSMLHKLHIDDLARILDSCFSSSVATNTGQYAPL